MSSKIFIYNTDEEHMEPINTSSITILTSGIPEYHIRIKNSFTNEVCKSSNEDLEIVESKPCKNNIFSMNEDVLMKTGDKLYLGTVICINNGKYLVKFDDNTEKWASEQGLKKLNSSLSKSENNDPLCVICKEKSDTDVVEVCNKCSRGYHRHCRNQNSSNFSSPWCCDRCTASEVISISDSEDNEPIEVFQKIKHPYDVSTTSLNVSCSSDKVKS